MKKLVVLGIALLSVAFVKSQTIEDAQKYMYYEKFESAKNTLQSLIAKGDAAPEAWYWLSEVYLQQNNIDSAAAVLASMPEKYSRQDLSKKDHPLVFIGFAHIQLDKGDKTDARKEMEDVMDVTKYKNPEALLAAAKANIESKNGDENWAIELLDKATKRDKKNPAIYTALGDAYMKLVDGSNAITNYDKALEKDPSYAEAMYKKGKIYKTQKNVEIYLDRFSKAYQMDSTYAPALYELYYYYYFRDVVTADKYLKAFIRHSDPSPQHAYMVTDLYYVSQKYNEAITSAKNILQNRDTAAEPRLYKLMAYSYAALGDSAAALDNMNIYFDKQKPAELVSKDFELKAKLLEKLSPDKGASIEWYKKALTAERDSSEKLHYMVTLADLQNQLGNREREAVWRERVYYTKPHPTNLDIYKWGMALYSDENYEKADSVFAIYEEKYPDQLYGYLWRARCNALIDTTMQQGLAVPHYIRLAEVASKDTVKNKAVLLTAYEYLGAYNANITKDYAASVGYFDKILQLDPGNSDADRNVKILNKWISEGKGNNSNSDSTGTGSGSGGAN